MSVETLRAVNGIGAKARVPVGHTLLVPAQRPTEEAEATLDRAVFTTVPQGRTFYYRVNRGETLTGIANRYDVSVEDLKRWNGLSGNAVATGQRLRITSDLAPNAATAKRATGKAPAPTKARVATKPALGKPAAKSAAKAPAKAPVKEAAKAKGATRSVASVAASGG